MSVRFFFTLGLLFISPFLCAENWPGWRGPRGDGTSLEKTVPVHWALDKNIAWKAELPGGGHASPVVWNDRVFTVCAKPETEERFLVCLDRNTGRILWQKTVLKSPFESKHSLNSFASSTPTTDGRLVYVSFLDGQQMVVAAYDFEGEQRWVVRPGAFSSRHGFCSSPLLFQDTLILNGDHDGDSYLIALAIKDGSTRWKVPRQNKTRSYCVPIIRQLSGRTQMILSGDQSVASYDPANGKRHWYMAGPTEQFVASLVYNPKADLLFMTGGYPELHILALHHNGQGTIGDSSIALRSKKGVSYVPSPISEGDYFLLVSDGGIASCFEAASGKSLWQERLGGDHHASIVSANGLVYFLSDQGRMTVVRAGPIFEVVARNEIGETCFSSPAISQGQIFLRGEKHVFAIGDITRTALAL
ncbi:MAG: PQQ-binding-like beta-propeller repeat protein [Verrucomicrobia bacterium]|nr:MAG: PQQ-binding-like beta-propeller repeat protein [Verrucomicrobiota bacterium]